MKLYFFTDVARNYVHSLIFLCHKPLKKGKCHLHIFYTMNLFQQVDHLCVFKTNVALVVVLLEHRNLFFSTQMLEHPNKLFVLDVEDSFWVAKVVHHAKIYQRLSRYLKRLLSYQQWDFHQKQFEFQNHWCYLGITWISWKKTRLGRSEKCIT